MIRSTTSLIPHLINQNLNAVAVRCLATHWNPRYKKLRAEKFFKFELPDYDRLREDSNVSFEKQRAKSIKEGLEPPISFEYKPINITTSSEIFDNYLPPEGDGKATIISKDGLSQTFLKVKSKATDWRHLKKIRQYEENFDKDSFALEAQRIFIEAHEALASRDSDKLITLVTESCYPKMWFANKFKTVRWKWVEALEPTQVVHVVTREMLSKSNIYAQITVRMHSKQTLAVYDRFGRLSYGDEKLAKNVLEYVVFEKHMTNMYGVWRVHDKIVPEWSEPKMPILKTYVQQAPYKLHNVTEEDSKFKKDDSHLSDIKENEAKPATV